MINAVEGNIRNLLSLSVSGATGLSRAKGSPPVPENRSSNYLSAQQPAPVNTRSMLDCDNREGDPGCKGLLGADMLSADTTEQSYIWIGIRWDVVLTEVAPRS